MSDKLQQQDFFGMESNQMSLQADSPAKTFRQQDNKQELREKDQAYGQSAPEYLGKFDPVTRSLKTSQISFLETKGNGLSEFCGTFPRSGMMRNGTVFQLPRLVRHTNEIECGLWPTPTATANQFAPSVQERYKKPHYIPTPVAHEARLGYQDRSNGKKGTQESLSTVIINMEGGRQKTTGQLNPAWVEWLMGYPEGWLS